MLDLVKVSIKTRTVTVEGPRGTNHLNIPPNRQHHDRSETDMDGRARIGIVIGNFCAGVLTV